MLYKTLLFFWAVNLDRAFALLGYWRTALITYLIAVKTPDKSHSRKGGFSLSQVPEHSPLWQEVAGHITAPGRKQRQGDAEAQLLFSLAWYLGQSPHLS